MILLALKNVAAIRLLSSVLRILSRNGRGREEELVRARHLAYLQKFFPHQTILFGWRHTPTMRASKVRTPDGSREVIVTTILLDGTIYHDIERYRPRNHYAIHHRLPQSHTLRRLH
jgi:hypothetical protein